MIDLATFTHETYAFAETIVSACEAALAPVAKSGDVAMGGEPGDVVERLLDRSISFGSATIMRLAKQALTRWLNKGQAHLLAASNLFSPQEIAELGEVFAATNATADMLGRALVRDWQARVEKAHGITESLSAPVPVTTQDTSYRCGAAALQAVLWSLGLPMPEDLVAAAAETTEEGTDASKLVDVARSLGLSVEDRDGMTLADLASVLDSGRPVICAVTMHGGSHWVVVTKVGGSHVELMDPARASAEETGENIGVKLLDFISNWSGYGIAIGRRARESFTLHEALETVPVEPLPPELAVDYFRALVPSLDYLNVQLYGLTQRRAAFTMAHNSGLEMLGRVQDILRDRIATGQGISSGPRDINAILDQAGVTPRNPQYAEMVQRTNMMDSYNVGSDEERMHPEVINTFPVWKYAGIEDGREGADHRPNFGNYYPAEVAFTTVRGKRVFNCRCCAIAISRWDWIRLYNDGARIADGYRDVQPDQAAVAQLARIRRAG